MPHIVELTAHEVERRLREGSALLVDVREPFEHATERIEGAASHPLGSLDLAALRREAQDRTIVFHCKGGKRSADACARFAPGEDVAHHLAGGIDAWKQAGYATRRSAGAPKLDVMRQVQIVAGSLVLLGVVLGVWADPGFLGLSAFVGAGLTFAGLSGWCGMAKLLNAMPWNRVPTA